MLGIFLFYFIGKSFYNLKEQSKKGKWLYVFYGILSYFVGGVISIAILAFVIGIIDERLIDSIPERAWDIIGIPFGVLSCWGLYKYLQKKIARTNVFEDATVLDSELIDRR